MRNFDRDRSRGGGNFKRGGFGGDRRSDRTVTMHDANCDNCRKDCQVPFRPTSGKPVFCSNCFEGSRGSDSRSEKFEEKRMFEAVCDECGNSCKVPFRPSSGKPIYCSNCFGAKKGAGTRENGQSQFQQKTSSSHSKEQFEVLNNKLDRILQLLDSGTDLKAQEELNPQSQEQAVVAEKTKTVKKRSPKKAKKAKKA